MERRCSWCPELLSATSRRDALFCSRACRQTAFRLRRRNVVATAQDRPLRMAYADPPYPGLAAKYYQHEPTYAGEVDHVALIASLTTSFEGWALSTSAKALRQLLPLCPDGVRVCAWVKPIGAAPATYGLHNTWEPLLVMPGRHRRPGFRDWLSAMPARGGGSLPGRKPVAFCAFLFQALGLEPGDELVDLFPGTGVVGRAWREICRSSTGDASRAADSDPSPGPGEDPSPEPRGGGSRRSSRNDGSAGVGDPSPKYSKRLAGAERRVADAVGKGLGD